MYNIQIHNCNNIKNGTIGIEPNKLNIKTIILMPIENVKFCFIILLVFLDISIA